MAKKEQPSAAPDYTGDEHWGKGGRFVVDPKTGKRVPAEKYRPEQINDTGKEISNGD